ncbi:Xaa-Pro peptidase family protein [Mesorhizobium sp. XAP10]|uniref:M24 family metallopeptidase n=1 Tax=unclassified Mesorhizobium TaxID=325217 RepID=UPI0023E02267|nr:MULTISPECIES: Xaa-Pro peptidase family protein [unclassified Mesorhizobium]MDF3153884.1 Xaa-Pro peptidase family protein [Mesorhizobium sp. XAP10]MDF3247347.1 Xaa-Pro peptidase family protein [Mesorhizobium sp. XAP4]
MGHYAFSNRTEKLLEGFEPSFDFIPVDPLPEAEFVDRLRRIRRAAVVGEYDALIVHTDDVGWYHTSNSYLRYICDWSREGLLIIPTDIDKGLQLVSFFSDSVVLPPAGEPLLVDKIWQVGCWGREYADRPGVPIQKAVTSVRDILAKMGLDSGRIGLIGDHTSAPYWAKLGAACPDVEFSAENGIVDRMQRVRSPREIELFRAAGQLIDIGIQAAYHVIRPGVTDYEIYAAFTFAQLSRGGETGDGYQIGINPFGTHCGRPYGHIVAPGDLINLYVSNVTYRGYFAQSSRMIAVGKISAKQEEVLEMCAEGVRRATAMARPGVLLRDINEASFSPFIELGYLPDAEARTMPFNWESMPDGSAREILRQYVPDADWERQGRRLDHIYPAQRGPHNPNLGHEVSMPGMPLYNISSNNFDRLEPGMVFVLHSQWLEPSVAGANLGDCFVVTSTGVENLTRYTPVETHRVSV